MNSSPLKSLPHEVSTAGFLGQKLKLRQSASGHRAGTDAVLLAAAAPPDFTGLALDAGSGSGAVGLAFLALRPGARAGLIENHPLHALLARENLYLNNFQDRGELYEADLLEKASRFAAGLHDGCAGLVLTNPPYLDPRKSRPSPDPLRESAHTMLEKNNAGLELWIKACIALLEPKGMLILIHRAEALGEILEFCTGRLGALTVLPIYASRERPAIRVLIRGIKGSRGPLSIAPGLVLHEGSGFSEAAELLHSGSNIIIW